MLAFCFEQDFNIQNRSKALVLRLGWGTPHEGGVSRYYTHLLITQSFFALPSITLYYTVLLCISLHHVVLHSIMLYFAVLLCRRCREAPQVADKAAHVLIECSFQTPSVFGARAAPRSDSLLYGVL